MKKTSRKILSLLAAVLMFLTMVAFPVLNAQAAGAEISTEESIDPEKVLYTFIADDFRMPYGDAGMGDVIVEDPQSSVGKAAMFSYEARVASGDNGLISAMNRAIPVKMYGMNMKNEITLGELSVSQLQAASQTDGYVVYLFEDWELVPYKDQCYLSLFECWGMQVPFEEEQVDAWRGKMLDVYISIKVTGDVKNTTDNPPAYYIDKVVIAEPTAGSQAHEHSFGDWVTDGENHSSVCSSCGLTENSAHTWDAGVVTKEPTKTSEGEKLHTCTVCGTTKTTKIDKITGSDNSPVTNSTNNAPASNQSNASAPKNQNINPAMWIGIGMFAVAIIIIAVALVLLLKKREK